MHVILYIRSYFAMITERDICRKIKFSLLSQYFCMLCHFYWSLQQEDVVNRRLRAFRAQSQRYTRHRGQRGQLCYWWSFEKSLSISVWEQDLLPGETREKWAADLSSESSTSRSTLFLEKDKQFVLLFYHAHGKFLLSTPVGLHHTSLVGFLIWWKRLFKGFSVEFGIHLFSAGLRWNPTAVYSGRCGGFQASICNRLQVRKHNL